MRYVVAFGGNAIGEELSSSAARFIIKLYKKGHEIIITHGNGPQVGLLSEVENKPLSILTAQTQAEIGTIIQAGLARSLASRKLEHNTPIIITRCTVDGKAPEMKNPSKPVGRFLTRAQADSLKRRGMSVKMLIGGYRRVVPSPVPIDVLEMDVIRYVLRNSKIVIAGGGGGVAVTLSKDGIQYIDAVIDKDYASSLIARKAHADSLIILTKTDGVYTGFGTPSQKLIKKASVNELRHFVELGEFEQGSMLPKVRACIDYVSKTGKRALIGNIKSAGSSSATLIVP